ncbi:hypothetical protein HYFRA_00002388 [Hymenoscyphus fraxineus]|uniref:Phosphoglycerate mutase-like protein n=1 Tax=Hymenoscyphus fraxineus TaxID=746836 RepID=A0A9N9L672_9HELO|nr:hypothetical protein HYFRA_00002388 [Hymenoscyphus fraxineus]
MVSLLLTTILSLSALAAAATNATQITWAAVLYTYHGEKVPLFHPTPMSLTPTGANQLYRAGESIRNRYLTPTSANASTNDQVANTFPIIGLPPDNIDNTLMQVLSTNAEWVSASATAFLQGLYPPRMNVPVVNEESVMGTGDLVQFPLEGYQYGNVETLGSLDFNRIWIAGHEGCPNYEINGVKALSNEFFTTQRAASEDFYKSMARTILPRIDENIVNFEFAYEIYEYALYQYNRNRTVFSALNNTNDLEILRSLASKQQWYFNTAAGGASINSIAGRSLAAKVFQQLSRAIVSDGHTNKLSLMFGSFQPFLSFFSLSSLSSGHSSASFVSLPEYGSVMSFELFSYSTGEEGSNYPPFPDTENLYVRFLFRNGSDAGTPMTAYPLFGRGNNEADMSWRDFVNGIAEFAIDDVENWCSSCRAVNLFCEAIDDNIYQNNPPIPLLAHSRNLPTAIAGIIGATITLAVFILLILTLTFLGFRIDRRSKPDPTSRNSDLSVLKRSGSGGFKGAEKLASDTDLTIQKGGAGASVVRHERVGSWELKDSPRSERAVSSLDKEIEEGRVVSTVDYGRRSEDGIGAVNPFGEPVKPVDHV